MSLITKCSRVLRYCNFSTSGSLQNALGGRFMNKVLKEPKSKKHWRNGEGYLSGSLPINVAKGATEGKRSLNVKRVSVLNKVFMRYITDLMATGNNSSVFLGRGIEINRVMVTPDFKGVNVFWIAKGTENDDIVEELLNKNAGPLRHELSQLRVMGVVPKLNFVKDRAYAKLIEVDRRLEKADFGDDYVPVDPSYRFQSDLCLSTSFPKAVKEQIQDLENDFAVEEEDIPPMRMDILGLNHADIMTKVQKLIKKSQATHRKQIGTTPITSQTVNEDPIEYQSHRQQKEAFQQFLLKRQILRAKARKEKDKYNPEYEYFRTENITFYEETPLAQEIKDIDDFIDEDDSKKVYLKNEL